MLGTLNMPGHFHQKRQCQLVETLMFIRIKITPFVTSFSRYCKLVTSSTLRLLDHAHPS